MGIVQNVVLFSSLFVFLIAGGAFVAKRRASIVSIALGSPQFSMLAKALRSADLAGVLKGDLQITLFAPTNDAFEKTLSSLDLTIDSLIGDTGLLTTILLMHVVPEVILDLHVLRKERLPTLFENEQLSLEANVGGHVSVLAGNRVGVLDNNGIGAMQAVVYPIDGLLLPEQLLGMQDVQADGEGTGGVAEINGQRAFMDSRIPNDADSHLQSALGDSVSSKAGRRLRGA